MFIERLNSVRMSIIFNLPYRFQEILIKIPSYLWILSHSFPSLYRKTKDPKIANTLLKKKTQLSQGMTLFKLKTYCKSTIHDGIGERTDNYSHETE